MGAQFTHVVNPAKRRFSHELRWRACCFAWLAGSWLLLRWARDALGMVLSCGLCVAC